MGGGGSSKATNKATQAEGLRQANINRSVQQINQIYGSPQREADINDFLGASRSFYRQNLDRQKDTADRSLKFAMARNGQTGGSVAVDANRQLGQDYQQGVLSADRLAQSAANELRNADEQSRMNMISLAQSGADLTAGGARAAQMLQANLAGANASLTTNALGDVFGGLSKIYENSRNAAAERRGNRDIYNLLYTPGFGQGGR
ncbi:hypothetical protein ARC78_14840 [Stenotrophomonas pictorum JCM 9942]|uniref:Uncharacterized protein n=1 Tax=Stenotrophomonas pictorum JCM 9942 TaxID=1236960 RepID=A0A0R0A1Q5_9GAMM|nr:hypothetical protein [Stenotrophomonas pictorum]KRG39093.1 hypothetical protein ARC78_14840 [Stenotrophomonas pictorum JCM 9942]